MARIVRKNYECNKVAECVAEFITLFHAAEFEDIAIHGITKILHNTGIEQYSYWDILYSMFFEVIV